MTGYTIKWVEVQDSYKATVAMANKEVQLVVANSGERGHVSTFLRDGVSDSLNMVCS